MKLVHLSIASIVTCVAGLAILIVVIAVSTQRLSEQQAAVSELFELQSRVNSFSSASDSLLLFSADEGLLETYRGEADALQARFRQLAADDPMARRVARRIGVIREAVEAVIGESASEQSAQGAGALAMPTRSRIIQNQVAGHGIALDTTLSTLLRERRTAINRQTFWLGTTLAGATLLFGAVAVIAFGLIHRRVTSRVAALSRSVAAIGGGNMDARVVMPGNDELAELGELLNQVMDQRQAIEVHLRAQEKDLRRSNERLDALLENRRALINALPANIALLDSDGEIVEVNDQWRDFAEENGYAGPEGGIGVNYITLCEQATGEYAEEAPEVAQGLRDMLAGRRDRFSLEYPCHSPDTQRWFRLMANHVNARGNMAMAGLVVMHVDVTERKLAEQQLNRLAYEDALTGLLSRNGFVRQLGDRFANNDWQHGLIACLDVQNLRNINDAHGYAIGDRLLVQLGERLSRQAGPAGLVARSGGDEFAVFVTLADVQHPQQWLSGLSRLIRQPFRIEDIEVEISVNLGYTVLDRERRDVEALLREAELALSQSQESAYPGSGWLAYTDELASQVRERVQLTRELVQASEEGQFELHFQPKVDLTSGRLLSAEALLRWEHPERGLQPPSLFIPVAEQSQLIGPIGDWSLREACRYLRTWQDEGLELVRVSVNVSVIQFQMGDFAAKVRAALEEFGVEPSALALEITESVFESESELLLEQIRALHDIGVQLALDDFGTGYSSLLYLQRYPFDQIKIDKGFVNRLLDDEYSREIVRTVTGLAKSLNAEVIAEGVESAAVRDVLLELGCRMGQGFYYGMPMAAEDFRWLLEQRGTLPLGVPSADSTGHSAHSEGPGKGE